MNPAVVWGARAVMGICGAWIVLAVLREEKLREFDVSPRPARVDLLASALIVASVVAAGAVHFWLGAAVAFVTVIFSLALWLDAVMFRVFTIELGPGGAAGVVPSVLWGELMGMARARSFLRGAPVFVAAIPAVIVWAIAVATGQVAAVVAFGLFAIAAVGSSLRRCRGFGTLAILGGVAAWVALRIAAARGAEVGPSAASSVGDVVALCVALACTGAALGWAGDGPAVLVPFVFGRPAPRDHGEATLTSELPARSTMYGRARGADVILLTVESMGSAHVGGEGARVPFLESLGARGVRSRRHFAPCPLTNEAHVVLYASRYTATDGYAAGTRALADAGYRLVYLTTADTAHYGLRRILDDAGFGEVIERRDFVRPERPASLVTDRVLPLEGAARVQELLGTGERRPLFLHVHTSNTHVPYLVDDPSRFNRVDARDDRGRYLNGLEEADALLAGLLAELERLGVTREPLVLYTADHGQAFGRLGYHSHGSAVTGEEVLVPFALAHPELAPGEVAVSSHFDVMPTVLDLLGLEPRPCLGRSIFEAPVRPRGPFVVWAGRPSRTTTSNYGLVDGDRKWMVDRVVDRVHELGWDDAPARVLEGEEKRAVAARVTAAFRRAGLK